MLGRFVAPGLIALLSGLFLLSAQVATASGSPPPNVPANGFATQMQDCLGPFRSAVARAGSQVLVRDPRTGATVTLKDINPGTYQGTAGEPDFLAQLGGDLQKCVLPVPDLTVCIDFRKADDCGDADGDGFWNALEQRLGSDPYDPTSTPESSLLDQQWGLNTCRDGKDNDRDGRTDQADPGCQLTCQDFGDKDRCLDSDGDGWPTYVELRYGSDPTNGLSTPESILVPGTCTDGIDNDLDGLTDAQDPACRLF